MGRVPLRTMAARESAGGRGFGRQKRGFRFRQMGEAKNSGCLVRCSWVVSLLNGHLITLFVAVLMACARRREHLCGTTTFGAKPLSKFQSY